MSESWRTLPMTAGGWDVVYADPPWKFVTYGPKGRGRCPDGDVGRFHYETMSLDEIKALPIHDITSDRSVLYLWATSPMLPQALEVMRAWCFDYKSSFAWIKHRIGTGYWARNRHEMLLVGVTWHPAKSPCPPRGMAVDSVIDEPAREHSRKPERAYEIIERYHPTAKKLELFARHARPGWTAWGNEAPMQEAA